MAETRHEPGEALKPAGCVPPGTTVRVGPSSYVRVDAPRGAKGELRQVNRREGDTLISETYAGETLVARKVVMVARAEAAVAPPPCVCVGPGCACVAALWKPQIFAPSGPAAPVPVGEGLVHVTDQGMHVGGRAGGAERELAERVVARLAAGGSYEAPSPLSNLSLHMVLALEKADELRALTGDTMGAGERLLARYASDCERLLRMAGMAPKVERVGSGHYAVALPAYAPKAGPACAICRAVDVGVEGAACGYCLAKVPANPVSEPAFVSDLSGNSNDLGAAEPDPYEVAAVARLNEAANMVTPLEGLPTTRAGATKRAREALAHKRQSAEWSRQMVATCDAEAAAIEAALAECGEPEVT